MAVKSKLNEEVLAKLGVTKLVELVLAEARHNSSFRRQVSAALAAIKGPDAVAAIIDRRLTALERARAFMDWEVIKTFANDLSATVTIITEELGKTDPDAAIDRLVRFLGAAETVFARVDDSSGRIQVIFHNAADAIPGLAAALSAKRKTSLLDRLHRCLVDDDYGFCSELLKELLHLVPAASIETWNSLLAAEAQSLNVVKGENEDWRRVAKRDRLIRLRQSIADYKGDSDAFIALEKSRGKRQPNTLAIAERLLQAGRHAEALEWVRKPGAPYGRNPKWADIEDGTDSSAFDTSEKISLELRILEAMGKKDDAQQLRWRTYLESLDANLLREYVARLGDFEEFDALDRAFAHAAAFNDKHRALLLFLSWPKLELASQLILDNRDAWDGRRYDLLLPAAEALEQNYPTAATLLYRTLLDFILDQGRSQAYGHAARYLANLDALGDRIQEARNIVSHATYKEGLHKKHGRKSGFWTRVV